MARPRLIHILGGGQWQVPSVLLAKSLGYRVLITDLYDDRPGFAFADAHERVDIADREATLRIAAQYGIDGIVCDTTDIGVPTMAYVADALGLPGIGFETALNFTHKGRMRELTAAAGIPNPAFRLARTGAEFDSAVRAIGLPAVVKPVDNQSSRGVHVLREREHAAACFADALSFSREREVIVETWLDGIEVTVESYCIDGNAIVAGISDKDHYAHRPEVARRLTYPAALPPSILGRVREVNARVIGALGLRTGVTHAEYMVVGSEVFLVEIAARGGGTRVYSHIAPFLAGCPIPEFYLRHVMGSRMAIEPAAGKRAANLEFFSLPAGTLKRIEGVQDAARIPGVQEIMLELQEGQPVRLAQDDRSRNGHVLVFGRARAEVLGITARAFEAVRFVVE